MEHIDAVKGGKGKNETVQSLAKMHNVSIEAINKEIELGKKIEREHSADPDIILDIVFDHLKEFADYYSNKRYGLIPNEKKMEKEKDAKKDNVDEERIRQTRIGNYFKDVKKANTFQDLEKLKRYYNQNWFDLLPSDIQTSVANAMDNKIHRLTSGDMDETIKRSLRLIAEETGLSVTDETPTDLTYNVKANGKIAGEIKVATMHPDLGKDTMEILDLRLDKNYSDVKTAMGGIQGLWRLHPNAMRIVVAPAENTLDFWSKLGFEKMNQEYLILNRMHNAGMPNR